MIRIAFVSQTLTPMGGGAKDVALTFLQLDRRYFKPSVFSLSDSQAWREEYGIPKEDCLSFDLGDVETLAYVLAGVDVVYLMVGTANEPSEYEKVWAACAKAGVKLRIMRIVFGLGEARPEKADLFLTSSMDCHITGTQCKGCHVIYPPLPVHPKTIASSFSRADLRAKYGMSEGDRVIGWACAEHRPEFFEVAKLFHEAGNPSIFFSSLANPGHPVPPNIRFAGVLRQREMPAFYDACDIILHARTESFGYSPHQAMAAERPVVALWTDSRNAFAETIYPGGGWLARDVSGLVLSLLEAQWNPEAALEKAKIGRLRTWEMRPENMILRFQSLVVDALREKGYFSGNFSFVPNHYVSEGDIENWRTRKAQIERRLSVDPFIS